MVHHSGHSGPPLHQRDGFCTSPRYHAGEAVPRGEWRSELRVTRFTPAGLTNTCPGGHSRELRRVQPPDLRPTTYNLFVFRAYSQHDKSFCRLGHRASPRVHGASLPLHQQGGATHFYLPGDIGSLPSVIRGLRSQAQLHEPWRFNAAVMPGAATQVGFNHLRLSRHEVHGALLLADKQKYIFTAVCPPTA